jgi:Tol biopolymer transport system component
MRDDAGLVQLWTVSPNGGTPAPLTRNAQDIASAFTWSPDGASLAHVMDNSVCLTDANTGETRRVTPRCEDASAPRPEACVFSPDGDKIAFVRRKMTAEGEANQICLVFLNDETHAK